MPHHHHHGDDHGCHGEAGHDHSNDITPALQSLLYKQVDFDKIVTMNESEPKAGAAIVKKTWDQRLDEEPQLESDADEQLLMHVPSVIPPGIPIIQTILSKQYPLRKKKKISQSHTRC